MTKSKNTPKLRFPEFTEEWEEKKFGDLFEIKNGLNKGKDFFGHGIKILNYMDVNKNIFNNENSIRGLVNVNDEELFRYNVNPNDLFFTRTSETSEEIGLSSAYIGKNIDCVFSGFILRARARIKEINSLFYAYYFRNQKNRQKIIKHSSITTRALISGNNLSLMKINLTSLAEQEKIANFLLTIDKKISLLENRLEIFKDFKKFCMQQLFARKLRFKNAKGEEYPKWEEKCLFDLGSTYGGLSGKSKNDFGNGKPYITYKSVFDSLKIDVDRVELVNVNSAVENQNKVKYGDIFFTISSETPDEVGMASVLLENMGECYLNSFCFGFRLNSFDEINPIFLGFYLRSEILRNKIKKLAQGSTRFNLSKNALMKTEVKIPSIIEQLKIANFLINIDKKIEKLNTELKNMKEFKKGLLQQMFI